MSCLSIYRYLNGIEARELLVIMTEVPVGRAVRPLDTSPLLDAVGNCLSAREDSAASLRLRRKHSSRLMIYAMDCLSLSSCLEYGFGLRRNRRPWRVLDVQADSKISE